MVERHNQHAGGDPQIFDEFNKTTVAFPFFKDQVINNHPDLHIDHIRPIASFDLRDEDQMREAFHFTNTELMIKGDNLKKGSEWNGKRWRHADHL